MDTNAVIIIIDENTAYHWQNTQYDAFQMVVWNNDVQDYETSPITAQEFISKALELGMDISLWGNRFWNHQAVALHPDDWPIPIEHIDLQRFLRSAYKIGVDYVESLRKAFPWVDFMEVIYSQNMCYNRVFDKPLFIIEIDETGMEPVFSFHVCAFEGKDYFAHNFFESGQ